MATDKKPVRGNVYTATEDGFARFLADANEAVAKGFALHSVVNLGPKKVGAVFMRRIPSGGSAALFGD